MKKLIRLDKDRISPEAQKLVDSLKDEVKGQERAINALANAFEIYCAGLRNKKRSIYCALFLGPSGVGKTFIAKVLAKYFFGSYDAFTLISCGNLKEEHTVSTLLGSPPGYVGYWNPKDRSYKGSEPVLSQFNIDKHDIKHQIESGAYKKKLKKKAERLKNEIADLKERKRELIRQINQLPEDKKNSQEAKKLLKELREIKDDYEARAIELGDLEKPSTFCYSPDENEYRSIIVFDEIEKGHQALHDILLEIMEEGTVTLRNGEKTNFRNSFIFMTSNVGAEEIRDALDFKKIGYHPKLQKFEDRDQAIYEISMEAVKEKFRPEFLNRLDKIIVFRSLSIEALMQILERQLKDLHDELIRADFPILIEIDLDARSHILSIMNKKNEGDARDLKHRIEKYIKKPLARFKNTEQIKAGDKIVIKLDEKSADKIPLAFYKEEGDGKLVKINGK